MVTARKIDSLGMCPGGYSRRNPNCECDCFANNTDQFRSTRVTGASIDLKYLTQNPRLPLFDRSPGDILQTTARTISNSENHPFKAR